MCGIFGLRVEEGADLSAASARALLDRLFLLSESRGKEAAGLAARPGRPGAPALLVHKRAVPASRMIRSREYASFLGGALPPDGTAAGLAAIGHSRLVTNGSQAREENNQPCADGTLAVVHNGIIVNDGELWQANPDLERRGEVDTEVILRLVARFRREGLGPEDAVARAFTLVRGSASVAFLSAADGGLVLATNTGSLYLAEAGGIAVFASEEIILAKAVAELPVRPRVSQVEPGTGRSLPLRGPAAPFALGKPGAPPRVAPPAGAGGLLAIAPPRAPDPAWDPPDPGLRRCRRCILPESMPFVEFDAEGVCRYCRNHLPLAPKGAVALEAALARHRRGDGRPDCMVAFSGGRDSSYGLHLLRKELGMTPIAFTYDWGMVTDLARRNQARMCGALGVEHILVSADIGRKRENIRRNVEAWLRRPRLGTIPLFMAGDKQFFWHANRLRRETGVGLVIYCENPLEITNFKTGFLGVRERGRKAYNMPLLGRLGLGLAYAREFLANPAYLNRSLLDTAAAYASTYFLRHDYLYLFQHLPWREEELDRALLDGYGWETSPDSPSTWRIGDGSAAFYNFIYLTVAGFTEFDTFRSNQIREGLLGREEALRRVREENRPRWDSLREYAATIGFDLARAVDVIRAMPKAYGDRSRAAQSASPARHGG